MALSMMICSYEYVPLDELRGQIRLLHLDPISEESDAITGSLHVVSLSKEFHDRHQFEALSYVWGDPYERVTIRVDGFSIGVTRSLYAALRNLRLADRQRVLWVDALCIDQNNSGERSHQVKLMRNIYGQASTVIAWFGEAVEEAHIFIKVLEQWEENHDLHLDPSSGVSLESSTGYKTSRIIDSLLHFLTAPWWKRLWTVQEFILGQNVIFQCGNLILRASTLHKTYLRFQEHHQKCCIQFPKDTALYDQLCSSFFFAAKLNHIKVTIKSYDFLRLVLRFRNRQATDPLDKIYGLLGLAGNDIGDVMQPKYDIPPEQLLRATILASMKHTGALDFLSHIYGRPDPTLPSFVPNWTAPFPDNSAAGLHAARVTWTDMMMLYNTCGGRSCQAKLMFDTQLSIHGLIFDSIATADLELGRNESPTGLEIIQEFESIAKVDTSPNEAYCGTAESRYVAFRKTLCGSLFPIEDQDGWPVFRRFTETDTFVDLELWIAWQSALPSDRPALWRKEIANTHNIVFCLSAGRRFIRSRKGYVGWAPKECKQGDVIVVLPGGRVPYVLSFRDTIDDKPCFSMLGDAYIHGIMDGECFNEGNKTGIVDSNEEFRIV